MKNNFQVSVIIPVYNAELYLERAVQSALSQKEVSEVILIEDNSPDNSLGICKKLANQHSNVKLYQHSDKKNHGAGFSRNLGIKKAAGEFISFLDADDYYLPGRFKIDSTILPADYKIDGIYHALGYELYDEDARRRQKIKSMGITTISKKIEPDRLFENMAPIGKWGHFSCDALTLRKNVFKKTGYFHDFELGQDTHLFVRLAAKSCLIAGNINEPVAIRGVHKENRVQDIEKSKLLRPIVFKSLVIWAIKNDLQLSRINLLWSKYIQYQTDLRTTTVTYFGKKKIEIMSLIGIILSDPIIIFRRQLYSLFPLIRRVLR